MITMRTSCLLWCALVWAATPSRIPAQPAEIYSFNTLGLGGAGDDSFVDMDCGDDMLPYTEDDRVLPARGNVGGTWGFAHHDINSNEIVDGAEHSFVVIRREDDDTFTFSANSHPEYGVIYEAEDWIDYHDANNAGPSATLMGDLGAEGNDFEINDRPDWEGESNAYLYNHLQANQHGKGKGRYYVEHINAGSLPAAEEDWVLDEIEGFVKGLNFQHNLDDPTTLAFNERGNCRNDYFRTYDAITRGYLIPVDDLADLQDGELPTLFGWETVDLAAYLRDVIAPKLGDEALSIFHPEVNDPGVTLPVTHLFLLQIEAPIEVNIGDTCGDGPAQAQAMADYWGIPSEGATVRVSHLLGYNDDLTAGLFGNQVRSWVEEPDDGEPLNLWLLDHFFRDDVGHVGRYTTTPDGAVFTIQDDPAFVLIDNTSNKVLATDGIATVRAPLPRGLGIDERPLELVVDLGSGSAAEPTFFQIAVLGSESVLAYAELTEDGASLRLGGEIETGTGWIEGGTGTDSNIEPGLGDAPAGEYTRFVLRLMPGRITVLQALSGDYLPNDFSGLVGGDLEVLASLDLGGTACASLDGIDEVGVSFDGPGVISTLALLAAPPESASCEAGGGRQRPADCNQDGNQDLSDGICILGHLFLGSPQVLPCGNGTVNDPANQALLGTDEDDNVNLTDAIRLFVYLFLGGDRPAGCVDGNPTACLDCVLIDGCPDNQACP